MWDRTVTCFSLIAFRFELEERMWMGRNVMSNASWNYIYVNFEYASRISSFFFFLFPFRSIVFETSFRCLSEL